MIQKECKKWSQEPYQLPYNFSELALRNTSHFNEYSNRCFFFLLTKTLFAPEPPMVSKDISLQQLQKRLELVFRRRGWVGLSLKLVCHASVSWRLCVQKCFRSSNGSKEGGGGGGGGRWSFPTSWHIQLKRPSRPVSAIHSFSSRTWLS